MTDSKRLIRDGNHIELRRAAIRSGDVICTWIGCSAARQGERCAWATAKNNVLSTCEHQSIYGQPSDRQRRQVLLKDAVNEKLKLEIEKAVWQMQMITDPIAALCEEES